MKEIAIIINSCDKYEDVIDPLFFTISKYWPDCEFKIYLITNFLIKEINKDVVETKRLEKYIEESIKTFPEIDLYFFNQI